MFSNNYILDSDGVWSREKYGSFSYSDGEIIERRLLDELRSATDLSAASNELQALIQDWPSEYHFSPLRGNLFSLFRFNTNETILEIGSGCGAMTRVLGERGVSVVALEGSRRRAAITRERCRDLDNVMVCCDTFEQFTLERKVDGITLIGVLEYSPTFISGKAPVDTMLKQAFDLLENDGFLIVGIENQLGLKYFNGCSEDHSGAAFTGINDDYGSRGFCTLGRKELEECLRRAGFAHVTCFYPFPDYKLPRAIIREEAFLCPELNVGQIVGGYPARDYTGNNRRFFQESRAWPLLERNGILADLANSFLFIAGKGTRSVNTLCDDWLLQTFSCPRKKEYLSRNVFRREGSALVVDKQRMYQTAGELTSSVRHIVGKQAYCSGRLYTSDQRNSFSEKNILWAYSDYLSPWIRYLIENATVTKNDEGKKSYVVDGKFLDCLPANMIMTSDLPDLNLIDQEWEVQEELDVGFVIFRGIYRDLKDNVTEIEYTPLFNGRSFFDVMVFIFLEHQLELDRERLKRYIAREVAFQKQLIVCRVSSSDMESYMEDFIMVKRCQKMRDETDRLLAVNQEINNEIERLYQEIKAIKGTRSWRIGRFLTGPFRFFFRHS